MWPKHIYESLTARIFLLTFLLLLGAGGLTFGLIAWSTPITYTAVMSDRLQEQADELIAKLSAGTLEEAGPVLGDFIRSTGAEVVLVRADGGATLTVPSDSSGIFFSTVSDEPLPSEAVYDDAVQDFDVEVERVDDIVIATQSDTLGAEVWFTDQALPYQLLITPQIRPANQAVEALGQVAPWLIAALFAFSLLCAVAYSRYMSRPILRLSEIARRMAELDFSWTCGETRKDEIGALGRSLDEMAARLSKALEALKEANAALRSDMEQERALERARLSFFAAASHELKTPVTILKGQLTGMLDGVGVYRDREKYLARSLQVAGRMETLVGEILAVSRMESEGGAARRERLELSSLVSHRLEQDAELLEQRGMRLVESLTPGLEVEGEVSLLGKAVDNLITNAALYSPEGEEVRVTTLSAGGRAVLVVENTGVQIRAEALPRLFEAFYREEQSRNRRTGGSGLGLYLVARILERHGAEYHIENVAGGVRFTASFPLLST